MFPVGILCRCIIHKITKITKTQEKADICCYKPLTLVPDGPVSSICGLISNHRNCFGGFLELTFGTSALCGFRMRSPHILRVSTKQKSQPAEMDPRNGLSFIKVWFAFSQFYGVVSFHSNGFVSKDFDTFGN